MENNCSVNSTDILPNGINQPD